MIRGLFLTIKYTFSVKGYRQIPSTSFPYRMGCTDSDMLRIGLTDKEYSGGVSLAEFHAAFLCSPIFRIELFLLSRMSGDIDPVTTTPEHLMAVAMGEKSAFGPWTAWAVEGSRTKPMGAGDRTACQIMQSRIHGKPFCDTWWAVEHGTTHTNTTMSTNKKPAAPQPELVFGTALIDNRYPLLVKLLDPMHRLYSRILLASAKATLVMEARKRSR